MKVLLGLAILLMTTNIYAATSWGGDREVVRIVHYDNGDVFIVLKPISQEPGPSCDNNAWLLLPKNHGAFEQMYSASLAALHSGKKLNGYIDPCVSVAGKTFRPVSRLDALP